MTGGGTDLPAEALEACAREPIRIPGSVQPHGVLLGTVGPDLTVVVTSDNTDAVLGVAPPQVLGAALDAVLGVEPAAAVREAAAADPDAVNPVAVALTRGGATRPFDVVLHRVGGLLLAELEPARPGGADLSFRALRRAVRRFHEARTVDDLARVTASEVRALTGFDRVMVYRFDAGWNGEVIAEERRGDMEPYLGLRYPATDIPAQARELYRTSWTRLIADVDAGTAALVPAHNPLDGGPLDLGRASLRSVSPVHLEYLRNMGVAASMSISLIDGGRLWGLVACHHDTPHRPSAAVRAATELLGQTASLLIATKADVDEHDADLARSDALAHLLQEVAVPTRDLAAIFEADPEPLLGLTGASGAAIRLDTGLRTVGTTPPPAHLDAIADALLARPADDVVATDSLAGHDDRFLAVRRTASGVLGVRIDDRDDRWLLWFRPEELLEVDWGGNPYEPTLVTGPDGSVRLHPRTSFTRWTETVRLRSRPWSGSQVQAAATLGRHLGDLIRRRRDQEAATAAGLQRMLLLEHLPDIPGLSLAARSVPASDEPVGGDWYDLFFLADGRVGITLGDVAGQGVEVAGIMAQLRHGLRAYLVRGETPAGALAALNELAYHLLPRELATVVVADLEPGGGRMRLSCAGHPPPLVASADGATRFLDGARGPALGLLQGAGYEQIDVRLHPGDTLLLFSDGLVERRGTALDEGLERLRSSVAPEVDLDALLDALLPADAEDDVTVLAVRADRASGAAP